MTDLDHPCKQTCSGWRQGYEKGSKDAYALCEEMKKTFLFLHAKLKGLPFGADFHKTVSTYMDQCYFEVMRFQLRERP